jgi:probable HAF family extracellular repeat protein
MAALWQPGIRGAQNLSNLILNNNEGWTLREAYGINDKGQIVGWGYVASGDIHAFRLDPAGR